MLIRCLNPLSWLLSLQRTRSSCLSSFRIVVLLLISQYLQGGKNNTLAMCNFIPSVSPLQKKPHHIKLHISVYICTVVALTPHNPEVLPTEYLADMIVSSLHATFHTHFLLECLVSLAWVFFTLHVTSLLQDMREAFFEVGAEMRSTIPKYT